MDIRTDAQIAAHRLVMASLAALAGLALWALVEQWDNPALPAAAYLAAFTFTASFSTMALALAGPVSVRAALSGALAPAILLTALVSLAGARYAVATSFLDDPVMLSVAGILVLFATPFLLVWMTERAEWASYARLFDAAWRMVVRYTVALAFVAVFWLLAFLGNALLKLVDVTVIDVVLRTDWARYMASGAILGLGLAVVHELRETLSPYLLLRLLRLLVPAVLAIVGVFLLAIPLRGFGQLFGEFSAAGTLMAVAIAAITLVSAALDRDDSAAVRTRGLRLATRALALILPLLAVLAVWAVLLRVRQYGLTPDRILALAVSAFLLAYGACYCGAALLGKGWMARIRKVNVGMALLVLLVGALWMTPVLNVYRLSAQSQLARYESGAASLDQLALWQMAHEWGKAGQAALVQLEAMRERPDHADLVARIEMVRSEPNPFQLERLVQQGKAPNRAAELLDLMPVRPAGATMTLGRFLEVPDYGLDAWLQACNRALPDGRAGCVLVQGGFAPVVAEEDQAVVIYLDGDGQSRADHVVWLEEGASISTMVQSGTGDWPALPDTAIADALDGRFDIRPSGQKALVLEGLELVPAR